MGGQQNEMGVLGEPINHCEYDDLAVYLGESLDEVHSDARPDAGQHW